ncbi:MAG TPA: peptidoglycan glycosyltransferase, partial [Lachnospiraceae bacterium]|nr:peptidoglycan glycosyltransferase [Lachnospiraceae bacterium]
MRNKTYNKKKIFIVFLCAVMISGALIGRLAYLMLLDAEYYQEKAEALHERERDIKAARGEIVDTNGKVLATNRTVCTISVIHNQITDPEAVIAMLSRELEMDEAAVRKRVEKVSSIERIKT